MVLICINIYPPDLNIPGLEVYILLSLTGIFAVLIYVKMHPHGLYICGLELCQIYVAEPELNQQIYVSLS